MWSHYLIYVIWCWPFTGGTFCLGDLVTQSKSRSELKYKGYAMDCTLCVITVFNEYMKSTLLVSGIVTILVFTCKSPYNVASWGTICHLTKAGVDLNIFSLHVTWGAASSKVVTKFTLATIIILKTAGWSEESICREHYKREIDSKFVFEQAILGQNQTQTARVHVVVCW